ncbi:MAG: hypothetical protein GY801_39125, partial [bacterium]|nr:hypothetical protein [bacterium]
METLEQAARESKQAGDIASLRTPPRTARLQATQSQGRRNSGFDYSDDSDNDYASVYGERSVNFESDESVDNSCDSDTLEEISNLSNQLAKLQKMH